MKPSSRTEQNHHPNRLPRCLLKSQAVYCTSHRRKAWVWCSGVNKNKLLDCCRVKRPAILVKKVLLLLIWTIVDHHYSWSICMLDGVEYVSLLLGDCVTATSLTMVVALQQPPPPRLLPPHRWWCSMKKMIYQPTTDHSHHYLQPPLPLVASSMLER